MLFELSLPVWHRALHWLEDYFRCLALAGEVYYIDSLEVGGWEARKKEKQKKWIRLLVNDIGNNEMNEILQAQSLL